MDRQPFISVIIPVWNDPAGIEICLRALRAQLYPRDRFEILVVDNGSSDGTADAVRRFDGVKLLSEAIPGSFRARNVGLREAVGEYVVFTDSDCVPDPVWLVEAAKAALAHPDAGLIGGRIDLFRQGAEVSRVSEAYENTFAFNHKVKLERGEAVTANWLSPRALMLELGGFDAALKSGGDYTMAKKIAAHGARLVYSDAMLVRHPTRGSIREIRKKYLRTIGGRWTMRKRHRVVGAYGGLLRGFIAQIGMAGSNADLGFGDKARLVGLLGLLLGSGTIEVTRLALGGEPRRS